jgi:hypothetical protein
VSPVKYEQGFYIPEDDILHSHCSGNLKPYDLPTESAVPLGSAMERSRSVLPSQTCVGRVGKGVEVVPQVLRLFAPKTKAASSPGRLRYRHGMSIRATLPPGRATLVVLAHMINVVLLLGRYGRNRARLFSEYRAS